MKARTLVNYNKISTEILKHTGEYRAAIYTDENQKYKVFTDGIVAYFIPESCCYLDIEKFEKLNNFEGFMIRTLNFPYETADLSNIYKKGIQRIVRKLVSSNKTVYVDNKYLGLFTNCKYEITDTVKPIIVRFADLIVGVIMPLRVEEKEGF